MGGEEDAGTMIKFDLTGKEDDPATGVTRSAVLFMGNWGVDECARLCFYLSRTDGFRGQRCGFWTYDVRTRQCGLRKHGATPVSLPPTGSARYLSGAMGASAYLWERAAYRETACAPTVQDAHLKCDSAAEPEVGCVGVFQCPPGKQATDFTAHPQCQSTVGNGWSNPALEKVYRVSSIGFRQESLRPPTQTNYNASERLVIDLGVKALKVAFGESGLL